MNEIILVTNIASPYRIYLFNELNRELNRYGYNMHVVFYEHMNKIRSWEVDTDSMKFKFTFFKSKGIVYKFRVWYFNPAIYNYVMRRKPHMIILSATWNYPDYIRYYMNKNLRKKLIMWTEINEFKRSDPLFIKKLRNFVYDRFNAYIVPGISSINYLKEHRINGKFIRMPNLINENYFKYPESINGDLKKILIVSRIIPIKQVLKTISYLIDIIDKHQLNVEITIIGEGTEENDLREIVKEKKYISYIRKVNYEEMYKYYDDSDLFILNSNYDPSPLSIIEGIRTGNVMLVTNIAGNAVEVVNEGMNGYTIDPYSEKDLEEKLLKIMRWDKEKVIHAKEESVRIYRKNFDSENSIKSVAEALNFILNKID